MAGRRRALVALVAVMVATTAACGTRLPDSEFAEGDAQSVAAGAQTATGSNTSTGAGATGTGTGPNAGPSGAGATGPAVGNGTGSTAPGGGGGEGGGGGGGGGSSGPNQASDVGITPETIKIGNITAATGVLGDTFEPSLRGLRAWVEHTNAQGGINGRRVELVTCDDGEDRTRSRQCAQKLIEQDQVFAFVATNSRALGGAAPYIQEQGVPVIGGMPITNSFLRYSHFFTVYGTGCVRDNNTVCGDNLFPQYTTAYRYFRENFGWSKLTVFYYDIPESKQAGEFIAKGAELEGFQVNRVVVNFANPTFDQAVNDMKANGTQVVMDSMDDGANRKLCDAMDRRQFRAEAKVSTIVAFGDAIGTDFPENCRNSYFITGDTLNYNDTSNPAMLTFRDAYARYQPGEELHQWAVEGWIGGMWFANAVAAGGAAPTRASAEEWLNTVDDFTADGMMTPLDFQYIDYNLPTGPDCFALARWQDSAGGWVQVGGFPICYPDAKQYKTPVSELGD